VGPGNWSGSAQGQLRTLRAGACLLDRASKRYLVYGYFSTATPPTMARVFQAYGCRYAMHLDMNALEHTYLALYSRQGPRIAVEHLVRGMSVLDRQSGADLLPRFSALPTTATSSTCCEGRPPDDLALPTACRNRGAARRRRLGARRADLDRAQRAAAARAAARARPVGGADGGNPRHLHPLRRRRAGQPGDRAASAGAEQCRANLAQRSIRYDNPEYERICAAGSWPPLYDPRGQRPEEAKACVDQFEFPGIPCEYPVVWVKAREAALICEAMGKRLCDAHEWEGACAGRLEPPDYRFELARGVAPNAAVERMRSSHNKARQADKAWSYGPAYQAGICATGSQKSPGCAAAAGTSAAPTPIRPAAFPSAAVR